MHRPRCGSCSGLLSSSAVLALVQPGQVVGQQAPAPVRCSRYRQKLLSLLAWWQSPPPERLLWHRQHQSLSSFFHWVLGLRVACVVRQVYPVVHRACCGGRRAAQGYAAALKKQNDERACVRAAQRACRPVEGIPAGLTQ
jgi:hypothetical protein